MGAGPSGSPGELRPGDRPSEPAKLGPRSVQPAPDLLASQPSPAPPMG